MNSLQGVTLLFAVISLTLSDDCLKTLTTSDLLFPYGDECTGICITFEPGEHATDLMELNQTYAFCEEPLHSISIAENGIVSFNERLQFTGEFLNCLPIPTIVGFWEDMNGQYTTLASFTELTPSWHSEIFGVSKAHALNLLRDGFGGSLEGFDPTHILILTWEFISTTTTNKDTIAKFQIVLVSETNKEDTYLLMLYDKVNNMDNVVAGFTGGTASCTHYLSVNGKNKNLTHSTNAQRNGSYVFRIHGNVSSEPSQDEKAENVCFMTYDATTGDFPCECQPGFGVAQNLINCVHTEPLALWFYHNTPFVSAETVTAYFATNRNGLEFTCSILSSKNALLAKPNCSAEFFSYTFTMDQIWTQGVRRYTLQVEAMDPNTRDRITLKGQFRVFGRQEKYFCGVNMINYGTNPISQDDGYVEYIAVGATENFTCQIDKMGENSSCGEMKEGKASGIYRLSVANLSPGTHHLLVRPSTGCQRKVCYKKMTSTFEVAKY